MLLPIVASIMLAGAAAFDGYYTNKAQKEGAREVGLAVFLYGWHPTTKDLIVKGGLIIVAEIAACLIVSHFGHHDLIFSIPLFVQSVFHIVGGLSGKNFKD